MKRLITIAISLLTLAACTKTSSSSSSSSSSDTTFTGSYINLTYSGKTVTVKGLSIPKLAYSTALSSTLYTGFYQIGGSDPWNIYGLKLVTLHVQYSGSGTGTFPVYNTPVPSIEVNGQMYSDTTGTVTISHSGTDYLEGSYSISLYGTGTPIPATGAFKIIH
jgi:hypothetical protein